MKYFWHKSKLREKFNTQLYMYHPLKHHNTLQWEPGMPAVCPPHGRPPSPNVTAVWNVWALFQWVLYTFKPPLSGCPPVSPEGPQGRTSHSPAALSSLVDKSQCQGQARERLLGLEGAEWTGASPLSTAVLHQSRQNPQEVGTWALDGAGGQRDIPLERRGRQHDSPGPHQSAAGRPSLHCPRWPGTVGSGQGGKRGRHGERPGLGPPHNAHRTDTHMPTEGQETGTRTYINSEHSGCLPPAKH